MPMYSDNPRRAEPNSWMYYSVSTPTVFVEHKLPVEDRYMTAKHEQLYRRLQHLAEQHGTIIHASPYRRG